MLGGQPPTSTLDLPPAFDVVFRGTLVRSIVEHPYTQNRHRVLLLELLCSPGRTYVRGTTAHVLRGKSTTCSSTMHAVIAVAGSVPGGIGECYMSWFVLWEAKTQTISASFEILGRSAHRLCKANDRAFAGHTRWGIFGEPLSLLQVYLLGYSSHLLAFHKLKVFIDGKGLITSEQVPPPTATHKGTYFHRRARHSTRTAAMSAPLLYPCANVSS